MKISVCMATYNGEKYIKYQLESILPQLSFDDEIIISDDSSTDNTIQIIESFQESRIKLFKGQTYHNPIFNFENALKKSMGDYIFLSDQDDVWLPNKVRVISDILGKYDCVVSDAFVTDADLNILYTSLFKISKSRSGFFSTLIKNGYSGCCMAFKRKILNYALPFPNNIPMHDIWIGLISELYGKTVFYKDSLIYYRRHGNNHSPTSGKSQLSFIVKFSIRYKLLINLLKRMIESLFQDS